MLDIPMASHKKRRIDEIDGEAEPTPKYIHSRNIMLRSIAYNTLRAAASSTPGAVRTGTNSSRVPAMLEVALFSSRYNNNSDNAITHADHRRFMSGELLYAVDAPNGDHDLQDIVREFVLFPEHTFAFFVFLNLSGCVPTHPSHHTYSIRKEESTDWVRRVVAVASVTEDAAAINESHNAVLGKTLFAVDAPDGEHDMEDVVS